MREYECRECGSNAMRVEKRDFCGECEFNGFRLDDEVAEKLGIKDNDWHTDYFDEGLRLRASKILGFEIERNSAYEGSCQKGEPMGDGCWQFYCYDCGDYVDFTPVASC